ncbi:kelch repeat protein [Colletotrichum plurivorum]|uniref:Kelch repeat protein n=1 Tax=Colletotrichum plurivorum TaxID=2175906 RepID=A0A8H6KH07_9PEZI|nr:kelch repeat protein [Colletotrichum plurivorum]
MLLRSLVEGVLLCLALQIPRVANAQSDWKLTDNPSNDYFLRRGLARVTVLGDYAYIDGGELSQRGADGQPVKNRESNPVNSTLSIDLSKSWSASNVTIRTIEKPTIGMDGQAMWKHDDTNTFFIWGGHIAHGGKVGTPESWKFEADGQGGGAWTTETPANPTFFSELRRNEEGAYASTPDGGFWFGGIASAWTNLSPYSQPVPGVLSYNMTTKQWANETTPGFNAFSEYGTMVGGGAVYIPTFGDNGLIVLLGGATYTLAASQKQPFGWMDFNNLTFYDPISKEWYWQKTTGTAPTARRGFCYVGAEGKNGTYEVFVFGGFNGDTQATFDDVFVLSLPGFVWTQVPYKSALTRRYQTCTLVGRRQMLSVGGTDGKTGWTGEDPWPRGLGLFDMTDWVWKTDYNADAADYETHKTIQDWYQEVGIKDVKWSSERVQKVFIKSATATNSTEGGPTEEKPTEAASPPQDESKKIVSTAVIAGVVVGVVLGLALVAGVFWYLRRRKQRAALSSGASLPRDGESGVSPSSYDPLPPSELNSHSPPPELHGHSPKPELDGGVMAKQETWVDGPKTEMAATHGHHVTVMELDAQQFHRQEQSEGLLRK